MAKSPTGIIPEEYMHAQFTGQVMEFLKKLPLLGSEKEELLFAWARAVGAKVSSSQRHAVAATGTDHQIGGAA